MKIEDAAKILNIFGDITPDIVKQAYRKACSIYHPDRNPEGLEMMKAVNAAYDVLKDHTGCVENTQRGNYAEELYAAIKLALSLSGVTVEICGSWVWLSGNTKEHKDALRESKNVLPNGNGFKWAPAKKMWYYRPDDWKSSARGGFEIDAIRAKYGSTVVQDDGEKQKRLRKAS